ncbi:MAG TPA: alpha/beta fold hydrolase [Hellea balneolensis]|uniref:Alpha/beta fold hydrolase n=1 Tax=Hellea balneolensis TaxID=287478 RepID=A0A7C5LV25_9PROT|nr:alpha/beta fold hydrolase [Hellea balneolensis]
MDKALLTRNDNIQTSRFEMPGGFMSGVHFGSTDQPIKLVFLHANGFHGLAYRTLLEGLGVHVLALDLRGHGHTALPTDKPYSFYNYGQDVATFLQRHMRHPVALAGHSLGAGAAIFAAETAPEKIKKVLAFDPIVLPAFLRVLMRPKLGRAYLKQNFPLARSTARRRDEFSSYQDVFRRYHKRGPFKAFPDAALWDYVAGGFVEHKGGVRLACRPLWEQSNYITQSENLTKAMVKLPSHSHLIVTAYIKGANRWVRTLARKRPDLQLEYSAELDHFFPILNPEFSANALTQIIRE